MWSGAAHTLRAVLIKSANVNISEAPPPQASLACLISRHDKELADVCRGRVGALLKGAVNEVNEKKEKQRSVPIKLRLSLSFLFIYL